jgi:cell division protein FtsW
MIKNYLKLWWNSIDHLSLFLIGVLIAFSMVMVATASPAVAERIGVESFYFIRRQFIYLIIAVLVIACISSLSLNSITKLAMIIFICSLVALILVLLKGVEIKGSKRWLYIFGNSLQPSEIAKVVFSVVTAYVLVMNAHRSGFGAFKMSLLLYLVLVCLLIMQPDFGMVVIISGVWAGQLFLAGLSMIFILAVVAFAIVGFTCAYILLPHVAKRINSFLSPDTSENYQIKKSLEAFYHGGIFGKGPGEGTVKQFLPDSHTDFIFAVAGEEFGAIVCFLSIVIFATIVWRGFNRIMHKNDLFIVLATSGLLMQFALQTIINIGVSLHILPTKGMTLPFISYGGSSMLATSIGMGMILGMTRKRYDIIKIGNKEYRLYG